MANWDLALTRLLRLYTFCMAASLNSPDSDTCCLKTGSRPKQRITCTWCLLRTCCLSTEPSIFLTSPHELYFFYDREVNDRRRTMRSYTVVVLTQLESRRYCQMTSVYIAYDNTRICRTIRGGFRRPEEVLKACENNASTDTYLLYTMLRSSD